MKTILIDPIKKTIEMVEHTGGLDSIYGLLECSTFEAPVSYDNGDAMYCDEEAWLNVSEEKLGGFIFPGWTYPILGKGLVVGSTDEGSDADCKSDITSFQSIIWKDDAQMKKHGRMIGML